MFEIGESLRQARERQGLELSDVERATRIAPRLLAALEDERFERFPARAYARAFLGGYAAFLGLDTQRFVDEFDARFGEPEPLPPPPPRQWRLPRVTRSGIALAAIGIAALVSVLAFAFSGGGPRATPPLSPRSTHVRRPIAPAAVPRRDRGGAPGSTVASLVLTAAKGDCWLSVHVGSPTGAVLYQGILTNGHSLQFARERLWIRIGAPWNLTARLDAAPVTNLPLQTGNVLVTRAGVRPV